MVDLVAEKDYGAVTVRELSSLAGISTRAFYQHYSSKEECFLRTHHVIVRQVLKRLEDAQAGASDANDRMQLAVKELISEWGRDAKATRLTLIDAYSAGPVAFKQARWASRAIEARLVEGGGGSADGAVAPRLVTEGIVAGLMGVARSKLLSDQDRSLVGLGDHLAQWALSYRGASAEQLDELDHHGPGDRDTRSLQPISSSRAEEGESPAAPSGEVGLLLSAVTKLAAAENRQSLTPRRIIAAAGVPRRAFYANFSCVDDCFIAALELHVDNATARARRAGEKDSTAAGRIYRVVASLCAQVAQNPILASLCFDESAVSDARTMRCHERLMGDFEGVIKEVGAPVAPRGDLSLDASTRALWGVMKNEVTNGQASRLPRITATLAYLLIAPAIGASAATRAMGEHVLTVPEQPLLAAAI